MGLLEDSIREVLHVAAQPDGGAKLRLSCGHAVMYETMPPDDMKRVPCEQCLSDLARYNQQAKPVRTYKVVVSITTPNGTTSRAKFHVPADGSIFALNPALATLRGIADKLSGDEDGVE